MTWAIFDDAHIKAIGEIIGSGSPRVTAIVGGALLDDTLRRTLSERFRNDNDITKKLLRVNGPLGNTVPKIDVLYQLGAIEKPVRNALYGLSTIRNVFAHNLSASFDLKTREMLGAIKLLTLHESRKVYPHQIYDGETKIPIETVANNRDKFLVNLRLCLIALMRDRVSHERWSNKPRTKKALRDQERVWKKQERAVRGPKKP